MTEIKDMYEYEREHIGRLRPLLAECVVLLRSSGSFPLKGPCDIAAYGKGVRHTVKGGTGSGDVNSRYFVSIEEGLKQAGFNITTAGWLDAYDGLLSEIKAAYVEDIRKHTKFSKRVSIFMNIEATMPEPVYDLPMDGAGDTAVYVLMRQPGEGGDRDEGDGDFKLTECEIRDIKYLQKNYQRFMLVLNVGGQVDLSPLDDVEDILLLSQLGVDTGNALADILLGRSNPSGKLTSTWMKYDDIRSVGSFGERDSTEYREGIYVGYRYFDAARKKPMFPFGYGLSYTRFDIKNIGVEVKGTEVLVSADIMNTGKYPGKEVFQVYISKPEGHLDQPVKELAAFEKTGLLAAGGSQRVTARFDLKDMASYDTESASYVLESGDYVILAGNSSDSAFPAAVLRLADTVITRKVRNLLGHPGFKDWRPEKRGCPFKIGADLPVIALDRNGFETDIIEYGVSCRIEDRAKQFSDRDLAYLSNGNFGLVGGIAFMLGFASLHVSGAAGESCGKVKDVPAVVMADGPAGLRLFNHFFRDKIGCHKVGDDSFMKMLRDYMPAWLSLLVTLITRKPKKDTVIEDQYCTAIPIGTAIAQSFNTSLAGICGDIVGSEMSRFGVQLWLAPALNIHRNALCGRNFEYYSEDPFLSGKMASAITTGVQAHKGCGVTLKHLCANNQEINRYKNDSLVSERALREIYLRGFEICIREAGPRAVMNSYNLLNGVHTSERRDLNLDILRDEFGFDGLIVSDWTLMTEKMSEEGSVNRIQRADLSAAAGTCVTMPGSIKDFRAVLKGLKNGSIPREQIEENVSFLLRTADKLGGYTSEK